MRSFWILTLICVQSKSFTLSPSDRQSILRAHNEERAWYGVPPLQWDPQIELRVLEHTDQCTDKHTSRSRRWFRSEGCGHGRCVHGENLAFRAGGRQDFFNWELYVAAWTKERRHWNCQTNRGGKVFGHWTQVVWQRSTHVGCALNCECKGRMSWDCVFACQYARAGNFVGARPFSGDRCDRHPRFEVVSTTTTSTTRPEICQLSNRIRYKGRSRSWTSRFREECRTLMQGRSCAAARAFALATEHHDCGIIPTAPFEAAPTFRHCRPRHVVLVGGLPFMWSEVPDWALWCDRLFHAVADCRSALAFAMSNGGTDCGLSTDRWSRQAGGHPASPPPEVVAI
ncbi:MAG: hypothetical protein KVP17_004057 [Porospora cf. gigantea B]|uniref:uncharacterized protein n=1 Tax=Porospora cf. gigantea B TaxID=2853592 RepID=UPI003571F97D|nr:MAG: hypothetical protein KVP17_004057 [Porospora cf. gigantea B]